MYTTYVKFAQDLLSVSGDYAAMNRQPGLDWLADIDGRKAYDIYCQARDAAYGVLVMGRTLVDAPGRTMLEMGRAITAEMHAGLGIITHAADAARATQGDFPGLAGAYQQPAHRVAVARSGMIMHFYAGSSHGYHFLYNDCWLLGGAHARHHFNLASPRWMSNVWADQYNALTATGRELAILASNGYRVRYRGIGNAYEVLVSADDNAAAAATLRSQLNAVQAVRCRQDALRFSTPGAPFPAMVTAADLLGH